MIETPTASDSIDRALQGEAARAVLIGSLVLAVFGGGIFVLAGILWLAALLPHAVTPLFVLTWASFALGIHLMARRRWIHGPKLYAVFLVLVALPTAYLVLAALIVNTSVSAFNIVGPASVLYFPLIIMTGFIFDERLSRWAGIVAGAGYFVAFLVVRPALSEALTGSPVFVLTGWPIYAVRSVFMIATGYLVGALASNCHRLIHRVLDEEREKQGISRLFGQFVSSDLPDPVAAALLAAGHMRRSLAALNEKWAREGIQPLDHGIGMHFGEVLQGTIGSAERKEFTVIGDTVNIAARLEGLTKEQGFPILVSAAFVAALPEDMRNTCKALGRVKLKGRAQEVEVLGVTGELSAAAATTSASG